MVYGKGDIVYYRPKSLKFDRLEKLKNICGEDYLDNMLCSLHSKTDAPDKKGMVEYFTKSKYLEQFLETVDYENIDDADYEWLKVQHTNYSRLLIILFKMSIKYESHERLVIHIKHINLSPLDITNIEKKLVANVKTVKYPSRVIKAVYTDAVKMAFEANEEGLVLSYRASSYFNIKRIFETSKKIDLLIFDRIENIRKQKVYFGQNYAILANDNIFLSGTKQYMDKDCCVILFIQNKKSKLKIKDIIKKFNLKIIESNIL